ncbi:DUF397 domain-containing protein [Streptomyces sp. NPDC048111]|uniref:DUF397 domain-containing protein n=1 Tax=Streptomyces sp. NPDC048111 TaxID=3365500 RepID=UPI003716C9A7
MRLERCPSAQGQTTASGIVPIRDSKATDGPALIIAASAWAPFIEAVKGTAPRG